MGEFQVTEECLGHNRCPVIITHPPPSVWKSHSITSNLPALSLQREEGGGIAGNDVTDRSL